MSKNILIKMSSFKFVQIDVASNYFHKQGQITDIFTVNLNKAVVFDKVSSTGKYWSPEHPEHVPLQRPQNVP